MTPRLGHLVGLTGVPLEEVAIAIAGEFRPVDDAGVRARLDLLAHGLTPLASLDPQRRVEILLDRLGEREGFDSGRLERPESLLIDRVLASRRGHPLLLAVVYSAVARRAGFDLHPVGTERFVLLGDNSAEPPLAIDPVPGGRRPPRSMRWMCPHLVGAQILGALAVRWRQSGALRAAERALELRVKLPLAPAIRGLHEHELRALRATFN